MSTRCGVENKPTVLIADDDSSTRMLLRATITQWDYPVIEASDGEEAWDILKGKHSPQIVTVDWLMPKIDGLSLCRRAKNLTKPPYMILLTSMSGTANIVNALDSGADDFLTKPFNYVELRSRLFVAQRIVNFTRKLEEMIEKQQPELRKSTKDLTNVFSKMTELSQLINNEWNLLEQYMQNLGELRYEEQITIQKLAHDIYARQHQLTQEIRNLGSLVEKRDCHGHKTVNSVNDKSIKAVKNQKSD
ncbi:response regulator [Legionella quateirensis]|uniref:DNA-binding response regulator n=1 Tax=Legionella quateirensis TaxID=45072 RepID=A0A378KXK0_9GAMM|nr:response regulator [Legionella quateirensis]KTD43345.1 DNA-binding response regulator [Legionella quateirensis]STY18227.1 DNA-binding response regulator in two-component regulatory system with QseC [Legionella quateirensis]